MANHQLEYLYLEVLDYVHPQIKDLKFGILHEVLYIILDTEPQQAERICKDFRIQSSATKNDDEEIIDSLIGKPVRTMSNPINIFDASKREIFWVVVVACILVGSIGCIQFILQRRKSKGREGNSRNVQQQPVAVPSQPSVAQLQPLTVALCLVAPAHILNSLKEQDLIDADVIEKLIDNSSYFVCIKDADAELLQQDLDLTDENISIISDRREVYVRIQIKDGQEILDKTVPYILKRNLPSNHKGVVKKLAPLGDLSGLEKFNRV
ncbi:MAG: hypothetical protein RMX35_10835 [Nostoc sp. DcaGUA01]|nr:hypothetical protein [Nostoc sp. DcaGUA01]